MARLQAQDYNSKRERIKQSATTLFADKGFYGTSIIDIAKACNTVKSRLYYYFPSKGQLFFEIINDHAAFLAATLRPIADDQSLTATQRLQAYARALLAMNVQYRDQHKLILGELGALDPDQARQIKLLLRRSVEALYPTLIELQPSLGTKPHLQFSTAMMFVGMINWTHTWYDDAGNLPVDAFAARLCDTFLNGFTNQE